MRGAPSSFVGDSRTRVLLAVLDLTAEQGYPPTVREIGDRVGISLAVAQFHLARLRADGLVTWEPGQSRTLRALVIQTPLQSPVR